MGVSASNKNINSSRLTKNTSTIKENVNLIKNDDGTIGTSYQTGLFETEDSLNSKLSCNINQPHFKTLEQDSKTVDATRNLSSQSTCKNRKGNTNEEVINSLNVRNQITINDNENITEEMVPSEFDDIMKDVKELEDCISAYISSFCIHEEEFDNYTALKSASEVASHFIDEMQSLCNNKTSEIPEKFKSLIQTRDDRFNTYPQNVKEQISESELHEGYQENCSKKSPSQKDPLGYSCWEDEISGEIEDVTSSTQYSTLINQDDLHKNSRALAPISFFNYIWEHNSKPMNDVSREDFLQEITYNTSNLPNTPWTRRYVNVLEEDQSFVNATANLNGYFRTENQSTHSTHCKIIELDDEFDVLLEDVNRATNYRPSAAIDAKKAKHDLGAQPGGKNPSEFMIQSNDRQPIGNDVLGSKFNGDENNCINVPNWNQGSTSKKMSNSSKSSEFTLIQKISKDIISKCDQSPNLLKSDHINNQKPIGFDQVDLKTGLGNDSSISSKSKEKSNVVHNQEQRAIADTLLEKSINRSRSRFVCVQDNDNNNTSKSNPPFLFSSPNVQLNLTNPLLNKKH